MNKKMKAIMFSHNEISVKLKLENESTHMFHEIGKYYDKKVESKGKRGQENPIN